MISLKQLITSTIAMFMLWSVTAQDLATFVPKNSSLVGVINVEQIKTKADFEELIKLPLIKKMDKKIAKDFSRNLINNDTENYLDLRKYGININSKSYFYFVAEKKMFSGALLLPISNKDKFTAFVKNFTDDKEGKNIKVKNDYLQVSKRDIYIIWNNNMAAFMSADISPQYKKEIKELAKKELGFKEKTEEPEVEEVVEEIVEEEVTEEIEEEVTEEFVEETPSYSDIYDLQYAKIDSIKKEWFKKNTANFLKSKGANSYASNSDFNKYLKTEPDAAVVFDYGLFSDVYMSSMKNLYPRELRNFVSGDFIQSFTKGMKMFSKIHLTKDDAALNFDMKYSKKINEVFAKVKKKKISKDFLKYMSKDIMGYYAMGVDIEGYAEGTKEMLKNNLPKVKKYGKPAVKIIEILELIIDEDALYNIFTGDVVVAVNGVKEFEIIRKTYDWDEDFNKVDKIDTVMQKMPEILFMAGVGSKEDVNKFISLMESTEVLKKEGNIYSVDVKGNKLPVYLRIYDDILFISNNKVYVKNPKVYAKNKQLNKQHSKMFKKNVFVAYANTAMISRYFADSGVAFKEKEMLTASSNIFKDITLTAYKKGEYMHSKYFIQLSETEDNSISDILKFMNKLYLLNGKKI